MCCNQFENWANCLLSIFAPSHALWWHFIDCWTKTGLWWASVSPREAAHSIKSNTAVGRQIKKARLLSLDWKYLILHGGSSVLSIKKTCVDPVDLEDSYYDHACLDPGSLDADALLQDRSDYMGKNLECYRCLWVKKNSWWFISSIYCQCQLNIKRTVKITHIRIHTLPHVRIHAHQAISSTPLVTRDILAVGTFLEHCSEISCSHFTSGVGGVSAAGLAFCTGSEAFGRSNNNRLLVCARLCSCPVKRTWSSPPFVSLLLFACVSAQLRHRGIVLKCRRLGHGLDVSSLMNKWCAFKLHLCSRIRCGFSLKPTAIQMLEDAPW